MWVDGGAGGFELSLLILYVGLVANRGATLRPPSLSLMRTRETLQTYTRHTPETHTRKLGKQYCS